MFIQFKKYIPKKTKDGLKKIRYKYIDQYLKLFVYILSSRKNNKIIFKVKNKKKIKVVFLVLHKSIWKADNIFKKMMDDDVFEPIILVCPYLTYGDKQMKYELDTSVEFFKEKKYPVISSYDEKDKSWIDIDSIKPDLLFYTNPYSYTNNLYYKEAFKKYLSCYIPYFILATEHAGIDYTYNNGFFHMNMWKIFMPNKIAFDMSVNLSANKAINAELTGYPACEPYFLKNKVNTNPWKKTKKKKLIWAPHHSIECDSKSLSNFIIYAEDIKNIALKYQNEIQWAFKPHPLLKSKLCEHNDWGKIRTEQFYEFWENNQFTQLETGDYEELFIYSDAMIHDCSSFLVEYLYVKKPVLYMMSNNKVDDLLNDYGKEALKSCFHANTLLDIEFFCQRLINNDLVISEYHNNFMIDEFNDYFNEAIPSDKIISILKDELTK